MEGRSLVPDLPLFKAETARALRIFKRLRIPDVVGQPTMAEACGEWFFPIVAAMFGSYDTVANRRMVQEFFLLIPKKNSKSSNGGALMPTDRKSGRVGEECVRMGRSRGSRKTSKKN